MTPDELRALADALLPMAAAPCFDGIDVERAAAYLRAQADAQPVAYRQWNSDEGYWYYGDASCAEKDDELLYTRPAPAVPAGWKWVPVEPTPEMLSAVGMMDGYDWHAPGCSPDADHANWYSAMIAAAPAAPQAEPKREDRPVRDLLAIIHCDGGHHTEAVGLDQSIKDAQAAVCELKRKLAMEERVPLSDDEILDIATAAGLRFSMYSDDVETRAAIKRLARAVERAHGIGGSDAE